MEPVAADDGDIMEHGGPWVTAIGVQQQDQVKDEGHLPIRMQINEELQSTKERIMHL